MKIPVQARLRASMALTLTVSVGAGLWSPLSPAAATDSSGSLEEIVVTASRMLSPLRVVTDPKAPRQPLPAHDGADYLKTIPGFSVIRKGGTDGDPVFRGMAASRVNVLVDGKQILGGCAMRMAPPTAYVFPEAFDRIELIKGPQTVLHGPGNSAATVLFDRNSSQPQREPWRGDASVLAASFDRRDLVGSLHAGSSRLYGNLSGTRAESGDYVDGAGRSVHSQYLRWNGTVLLGWVPGERSRIELSGAMSDGQAAYADRAMDGVAFERESLALLFEHEPFLEAIRGLEGQLYYNYVDHVMDNYSLRDFRSTPMMPNPAATNPDRETLGGGTTLVLDFGARVAATVGLDAQANRHTLRSSMNETMVSYTAVPRQEDARFRNAGLFGELELPTDEQGRFVLGARSDWWRAEDARDTLRIGMMSPVNPTAGMVRHDTLVSGFGRYERSLAGDRASAYVGLGHVERFPDYWELVSLNRESPASLSAFETRPERTTQLDVGLLRSGDRVRLAVSAFASRIEDYILIESNYPKGQRQTSVTHNVDATTWGGEADAELSITESWRLTGTLAYVQGQNESDDRPLAQMPPLEARLGLDHSRGAWTFGSLLRVVAAQNRYAVNEGNVVGQDLGPTGGFAVVSLNASWQPTASLRVHAGVDNVFDREYAEHLSRAGAMVSGFEQTTRVSEAGRTLWLKLNAGWR